MCVGLYPNTEPCGRALTQGLVRSSPLFLFVLPLAGEHGPPVDCGDAVMCWRSGAGGGARCSVAYPRGGLGIAPVGRSL